MEVDSGRAPGAFWKRGYAKGSDRVVSKGELWFYSTTAVEDHGRVCMLDRFASVEPAFDTVLFPIVCGLGLVSLQLTLMSSPEPRLQRPRWQVEPGHVRRRLCRDHQRPRSHSRRVRQSSRPRVVRRVGRSRRSSLIPMI